MNQPTTNSDNQQAPSAAAVVDLPDQKLEDRLKCLARIERKALALLLAHLGEFDRRRLYADRGQPSLFQYCLSVLGYSEQAAYKRIQAARAAREHPLLLEHLSQGKLHLAAIVVLAPHLQTENLQDMLAAARGKSKHELEILAAGLAPRSDCRDMLKALPASFLGTPTLAQASDSAASDGHAAETPRTLRINEGAARTLTFSAPREQLEALSPGRFLFRFTGGAALRAKYIRVVELLRPRLPDRTMEDVFETALDALLDRLDPARRLQRRELRAKSSGSAGQPPESAVDTSIAGRSVSRSVSLALRDEVWRRDEGRCAFVGSQGLRCPATRWLEIDHIHPYARGGRSDDPANLRLLCRAHNLLMARRIYGRSARRQVRAFTRVSGGQAPECGRCPDR